MRTPNRRNKKMLDKTSAVCAAVAVLLLLWSAVFAIAGAPDPLGRALTAVSAPLTGVFDRLGGGVSEWLSPDMTEQQYKEQIASLRAQLAAERARTQQLQSALHENEQLHAYLSLPQTHTELSLCHARRLYSSDVQGRSITLSRGSRDGVAVGMPVLDGDGLIGVVSEVTAKQCRVSTLLDERVFVGVTDARSGLNGTLCGLEPGEVFCTLKYLENNQDYEKALRVGDVIVTAGSDQYPAGLPVGEIVQVGADAYDRSPYALVRLYAEPGAPSSLLMIVTGERVVEPEQTPPEEDPLPSDEMSGGEQTVDEEVSA